MARRRGFGEVERRAVASGRVTYRARYAMPNGTRYSRTLATKLDAEAWLAAERALIDREVWTPPRARQAAREKREAAATTNTVAAFSARYLAERGLRPTTIKGYRTLLTTRILPMFGPAPLTQVTLTDIKLWRASLNPRTEATNAAAYRLFRSILAAAEEEELIDRAPPKIRGAGSAQVRIVAKPATFEEIETITGAMPPRLRLLIVLGAFVGLRQGELLELRRSDVDGISGRINVTRKVDKDVTPGAEGECAECGRVISSPKTASGVRTVHVPPPFLPVLQRHPLEHAAAGPEGLLFPGDRTDHMSVRYLMDRYRPAREAAGRPDLTDNPPPPAHSADHSRPARRYRRGAASACRPRVPGGDGDLPARHT